MTSPGSSRLHQSGTSGKGQAQQQDDDESLHTGSGWRGQEIHAI